MVKRYGRKRSRSARKSFRKRSSSRAFKRARVTRPTMVISRSSLIPDRYFCKLKYSEQFGMIYTPATAATYQFRANSIYDPNYTGTGHQPLGHDQLITLYNRYRVYGCKYRIFFTNISTTEQAEVAVQLRPNLTVNSVYDTIRESAYTVWKSILGVEGSGQATRMCKGYASIPKLRGCTKTRMKSDDSFQAIVGNNPSITPSINLHMQNQDVGTGVTVRARVDLVYLCEFFDRKDLDQS